MQTSRTDTDANIERVFRLSYQQGRTWANAQVQPSGPHPAVVATVQCGMRIEGPLNASRLRQAVQKTVDRHEILRTKFVQEYESSEPLQAVALHGSVSWRSMDLSDCNPEEKARQVNVFRAEDFREPFVLDENHLLRVSLLGTAPGESVLILTVPALCADTATMQTLSAEIVDAYEGGDGLDDGEETLQYASVSEWQRSLQDEEDASLGRKYWSDQPFAPPPIFALQRISNGRGTFSPTSFAAPLSAQAQAGLCVIEREEVFLFGCWLALLRAVTNQTRLRVGFTCHGRHYEELRGVVGPLARVLPVICSVPDGARLDELGKSLAELVDLANDWHEFYQRKKSEGPYEPVAFEYYEWRTTKAVSHDVRWSLAFAHSWSDRFHIKLALHRNADNLLASVEFDPDVFDPEYVAKLSEQLAVLIDAAIRGAHSQVDELPILSDKERQFLIAACNHTQTDFPREALLHQLIAEQAARTPHRIAVTFQGSHLTYEELDRRANQLAHALRQLRVGPEVRVGIFMHRSLEMIIAILGVLKADGAYVPLEPAYPAERLSFMLEDAQVATILTQQGLRQGLPKNDAEVLCIDDGMGAFLGQPACEPQSGACAENLAYALYTSGSTGRPKGAMISHRNLVNYLHWCCTAYSVDEGTGTPVHSSIGFDATITALFPPLLVGSTVVLLRESDGVDGIPEALGQTEGFSLIKITPAHLSLLNEFVAGNRLACKTRMLVIGGDALAGSQLSVWRRHAQQTRLINEYGPTETVVGCCIHEASEPDFACESVPIGRPIANTRLYVLDRRFHPVPSGVPGELFIAGEGVCRGYLGRPGITAERFVPDGLSGNSGGRMYRTGDLVVQNADGVLCFLGRLDRQVKIRSYRIELGEIEAQLGSHPSVSQSAVVARTVPSGDKSLVAYIQPSGTARPTAGTLRVFLLEKLPEYMVPAAFVILDKLPLTAHGKIDRGALPDPETMRTAESERCVPPNTSAEAALAAIWREVLKLDRIGIHDDFFSYGGDSIQSILIVARAAKIGLRFTTRDLFRNPTIAGLAAAAGKNSTGPAGCCELRGVVPLTPIQRWFFEQRLPNPNHFNQSVLLEMRSDIRADWVRQVFEGLVACHDALRLRFTRQADTWVQEYSESEGTVIVEEKDLGALPAQHRQAIVESLIAGAQSGLHISDGPLVRAVLFRFGVGAPVKLLLSIHHLVIDGVSWRILLDDFATAYRQIANGEPIQLTPPTSSFRAWAARLEDYAHAASLSDEADYWRKCDASISCIPADFDSTVDRNTAGTSASVQVTLGPEQTFTLLHRISDVYHTEIDDLLLTAMAQALTRWNGSRASLIDCEGHGRVDLFPDADTSRTVGWFTSIYPMRLDLSGTRGPGEELKAIKEQRRKVPHKGFSYGVLRYLSPDTALRDRLAALPNPQISFNYLGSIDEVGGDPLLGVASVALDGEQDPMSPRRYLLDVIAYVQNNSLHLQLVYSTGVHRAATIEHLGNDILACIESLLDHCLSPSAGGFTPSDFPGVALSQSELDELEAEFE